MPKLILLDFTTHTELSRRPMDAHERLSIYQARMDHELFTNAGHHYTLNTVAWNPVTEILTARVTYHSSEHAWDGCE